MAKNRKNIGRVKRYNHNFYNSGRTYWAKRVGVFALVVVLVFVLGIFFAPALLDWGTHFWYTSIKHKDLDSVATAPPPTEAPAETDADASITEPEQPDQTPVAAPTADGAGMPASLQMLRLSALQSPEAIQQTAQALKEQGVSCGVVPLKDESGYLYYNSAVPQTAESIAASTIDPAAVAAALREQGITPAASIAVFKDPMVNREMGIRYAGEEDFMWLDNKVEAGGKRWMNPYSPAAVQYIGDLIQEAHDMGYETIILTGVQFPRQQNGKQDFGDTQGRDRAAQLLADVTAWEERFAGVCNLIYEMPYESCVTPSAEYGSALPGALGMKQVLLRVSAPNSEEDPDASQIPVTQEEVLTALYDSGVQTIAVRSGINGQIVPAS